MLGIVCAVAQFACRRLPLRLQSLAVVCAQDRRDVRAASWGGLGALRRGFGRLIMALGTSRRASWGAERRREEGGTGVSARYGGFDHLYFPATCHHPRIVSSTRSLDPVAGLSRRRAPLGQPGGAPLLLSGGAPVISRPVKINYFLCHILIKLKSIRACTFARMHAC